MLRWLLFLLFLSSFAIYCAWLFAHDNSVRIETMGYQIETSSSVLILSALAILILSMICLHLFIGIIQFPSRYRLKRRNKHYQKGLLALTEGFSALAIGDTKHAHHYTKQAISYLGNLPITQLLKAQTAQNSGNLELASTHYNMLLNHKETKAVAIRGLLLQAKQEQDLEKAIFLAEKALTQDPKSTWPIPILIELYKRTQRWDQVQVLLPKAKKYQLIADLDANHIWGISLLMQSLQLSEQGHHTAALQKAHSAYKRLPQHVEVVTHYAHCLILNQQHRKAFKILETSWEKTPHYTILHQMFKTFENDTNDKKLQKIEKILDIHPTHPDAHIIAATINLRAHQLQAARNHLKTALSYKENPEICRLMAELEQREHASPAVINQWLDRACHVHETDLWRCQHCQTSLPQWQAICVYCHSFDSILPILPNNHIATDIV